MTLTPSVMDPFLFRVPSTLWTGTGFGRGQVSSLCFWMKAQLINIPVVPKSRRVEVEMECREVVVWSSMLMLRAQVDLDRTYMDGGQLQVVAETLTLASLWVCLYSLVFLTSDVISRVFTVRTFFTKQPGCTSHWLQV